MYDDGAVIERDLARLIQAIGDHEADHGCTGVYGCPIRAIIAQADMALMLYWLDVIEKALTRP